MQPWLPSAPPAWAYLTEADEERGGAHGVHEAAVIAQQGRPAASQPQVELLRLVVVAVVRRVVGELVLDAGPRRAGVAAAEGDAVHQVPPVHVALDATGEKRTACEGLRGLPTWRQFPPTPTSEKLEYSSICSLARSVGPRCALTMCRPLCWVGTEEASLTLESQCLYLPGLMF